MGTYSRLYSIFLCLVVVFLAIPMPNRLRRIQYAVHLTVVRDLLTITTAEEHN